MLPIAAFAERRVPVEDLPPGAAERNLAVQGFHLDDDERRRLRIGLRFSTGVCLALVLVVTASGSAAALLALSAVGAAAGWSERHPFDRVWNRVVRHALHAPPVPTTPRRRRHAFKVAGIWLAVSAGLLAIGATAAALALLGVLVVLCAIQTLTYLCVPSLVLAGWERLRGRAGAEGLGQASPGRSPS